jgi:hypothetical protein
MDCWIKAQQKHVHSDAIFMQIVDKLFDEMDGVKQILLRLRTVVS